jgi:probable HAF family extracellular repeat protein
LYTVVDLAGDSGLVNVRPCDINDLGQVVGSFGLSSATHSFLYEDGQLTDLGRFGGQWSVASGVNNHGQIAGSVVTTQGATGYLYSREDGYRSIGTFDGLGTRVEGISDSGQIVGTAYEGNSVGRAFSYDQGAFTDLGTLGGDGSIAVAVNGHGQVAGLSTLSDGSMHLCIFEPDGSIRDLGIAIGYAYDGYAYDINDAGMVVGRSSGAFLCDADGVVTDLGNLPGDYHYNSAYGLNNAGQVVGEAGVGLRHFHAFIYEGSQMKDLNSFIAPDSGWELLTAYEINNLGQIVGVGMYQGQRRGFLLNPIPEPASMLTLALGSLALIHGTGRKSAKSAG